MIELFFGVQRLKSAGKTVDVTYWDTASLNRNLVKILRKPVDAFSMAYGGVMLGIMAPPDEQEREAKVSYEASLRNTDVFNVSHWALHLTGRYSESSAFRIWRSGSDHYRLRCIRSAFLRNINAKGEQRSLSHSCWYSHG